MGNIWKHNGKITNNIQQHTPSRNNQERTMPARQQLLYLSIEGSAHEPRWSANYPNSWMGCFMENPSRNLWFGGTMDWKPPYIYINHIIYIYIIYNIIIYILTLYSRYSGRVWRRVWLCRSGRCLRNSVKHSKENSLEHSKEQWRTVPSTRLKSTTVSNTFLRVQNSLKHRREPGEQCQA